jgi:ATP-dependent helicase/nuclease subunit B
MYCKLFHTRDSDTLILTVNRRLTTSLRHLYDESQKKEAKKTWPSLNIMPINTWLTQLWQENQSNGYLLSSFEEQTLWQGIIKQYDKNYPALQISQTAKLTQQAWNTLQQWNMPLTALQDHSNSETDVFSTWAQQFQEQCTNNKWYGVSQLPKLLSMALLTKPNKLPKNIILIGFEELSPALSDFINQVKSMTELSFFKPSPQNQTCMRTSLATPGDELLSAALWSKQLLSENKGNIGVVIADLANTRSHVKRAFDQVFNDYEEAIPFNLSAGQTLCLFPMIRDALVFLKLLCRPLELELVSQLLLSPYINFTLSDRSLAAQIDIALHKLNKHTLSLNEIFFHIDKLAPMYPDATLPERIRSGFHYKQDNQQNSSALHWMQHFQQALTHIGWPSSRNLNSEEHQLIGRFQETLYELTRLDNLLTPHTFCQSYDNCYELCKNSTFQAKTEHKPLQIVGLIEALGSEFDHLWVMGFDDETWPASAKPNPFIPVTLQRDHNMPHASSGRELQYSHTLQQSLIDSTKHLIFSYASQSGDKHLNPSRLIVDFPILEEHLIPRGPYTPQEKLLANTGTVEAINDTQGPKITETEKIQGGSWILQQQSSCPFRAFSSVRLQTGEMIDPQFGLTSAEKGTLTHLVLEILWKQIKNHENLCRLTEEETEALINTAINQAFNLSDHLKPHYLSVERKRLLPILKEWLAIEESRPPFTVLERETKRYITIGPLSLKIQIDRIDTLSSGQQFIIDYKTGKSNSIFDWLGDRIKQPQLPIYCLFGTENAVGISYAQVHSNDMKFTGILKEDSQQAFSGVKPLFQSSDKLPNWETLSNLWREKLEQLSIDFYAGNARVDPIDKQTCTYCNLQPLCRIGEIQ